MTPFCMVVKRVFHPENLSVPHDTFSPFLRAAGLISGNHHFVTIPFHLMIHKGMAKAKTKPHTGFSGLTVLIAGCGTRSGPWADKEASELLTLRTAGPGSGSTLAEFPSFALF